MGPVRQLRTLLERHAIANRENVWNGRPISLIVPGEPLQVLDGKVVDIARAEQAGGAGFGFGDSTTYRRDDITATLAIQIATRSDLVDGAIVPTATLSLAKGGGDALVVPVGGLIGCAKSPTP